MIGLGDRVVHLADRLWDIQEYGTVQELFDYRGAEMAIVAWDGSPNATSHPVANLVRIEP